MIAIPLALDVPYLPLQSESRKFGGGWKWGTGATDGRVRITSPVIGRADSSHREKEGPISRQEYLRARLYRHYKREAEESDREFMKKYDDDLNTTLIFVSLHVAQMHVY